MAFSSSARLFLAFVKFSSTAAGCCACICKLLKSSRAVNLQVLKKVVWYFIISVILIFDLKTSRDLNFWVSAICFVSFASFQGWYLVGTIAFVGCVHTCLLVMHVLLQIVLFI